MACRKLLPAFLAFALVGDASSGDLPGQAQQGVLVAAADPLHVEGTAYSKALDTNMAKHKAESQQLERRMQGVQQMQDTVAELREKLDRRSAMDPSQTSAEVAQIKSELEDLSKDLGWYLRVQSAKKDMTDLTYERLAREVASLEKRVDEFGHLEVTLPPTEVGQLSYEIPSSEGEEAHVVVRALDGDVAAKGGAQPYEEEVEAAAGSSVKAANEKAAADVKQTAAVKPSGGALDVDTQMPYGELRSFGREDTAKELTEASIRESDAMVDQIEKAEVAEEKRAVFRSLTRLRGAAITSFDGVARAQTGNIDQYASSNKFRQDHPVHHLAQDEADVSAWAFPTA